MNKIKEMINQAKKIRNVEVKNCVLYNLNAGIINAIDSLNENVTEFKGSESDFINSGEYEMFVLSASDGCEMGVFEDNISELASSWVYNYKSPSKHKVSRVKIDCRFNQDNTLEIDSEIEPSLSLYRGFLIESYNYGFDFEDKSQTSNYYRMYFNSDFESLKRIKAFIDNKLDNKNNIQFVAQNKYQVIKGILTLIK